MQPLLRPHVDAVIARLESDGLVVGNHKAPQSPDGLIVAPCVVVYLLPGGAQSGDLGEPENDAWLPLQLTCIGLMAEQAMETADLAHTSLKSSPLSVSDRLIARFRRTYFGAAALRDDDVTPPLFYVPAVYRAWTLTT